MSIPTFSDQDQVVHLGASLVRVRQEANYIVVLLMTKDGSFVQTFHSAN